MHSIYANSAAFNPSFCFSRPGVLRCSDLAILIAQTCNQGISKPGLFATIIAFQPGLIATEPGLFATNLQSSVSTRIICNYKFWHFYCVLKRFKVAVRPPTFGLATHANAPDQVVHETAILFQQVWH